jgi:class 3 adenylate cyclase
MVHFGEPAGAVLSALQLVAQFPEAGLPPAHVGVAAGPVVVQGGDYFGRTVNLAARIAAYASAGRVLVTQRVVERAPPPGCDLRRAGAGAAGGHRPSSAAAGGPPGVASDASASSWPGPTEPSRPGRASPRPATTHELLI